MPEARKMIRVMLRLLNFLLNITSINYDFFFVGVAYPKSNTIPRILAVS